MRLGVVASSLALATGCVGQPASDSSHLNLPAAAPLAPLTSALGGGSLALSPDGSRLVYVGAAPGGSQLFQLDLTEGEATVIAGTMGAFHPFFSPDGQQVGFFTSTELKRVPLSRGLAIALCSVENPMGGSWGSDGNIYFADELGSVLKQVSADGGEPGVVASTGSFMWPEAVPGSEHILVSSRGGGVRSVSVTTGEATMLLEDGSSPKLATGLLIYGVAGRLMSVAYDAKRHRIDGAPNEIGENVRSGAYGDVQFAVTPDGFLAYVPGTQAGILTLSWADRNGALSPLLLPPDRYGSFRLSPDGTELAVEVASAQQELWIYDLLTLTRRRLTFEANNGFPVWSPDGQWLVFTSDRDGAWNLYRTHREVDRSPQRLTSDPARDVPFSWSPDGDWIAFTRYDESDRGDIWLLAAENQAVRRPIVQSAAHESQPEFSPDGRVLAYVSDETGTPEVYLRRLDHPETARRVTLGGGEEPLWSPDGAELIFRRGIQWLAMDANGASEPVPLFEGDHVNHSGRSHHVASDGGLLLIERPPEPSAGELVTLRLESFASSRR